MVVAISQEAHGFLFVVRGHHEDVDLFLEQLQVHARVEVVYARVIA